MAKMSTEYYADYIKKTTFDPESHSTRSKMEEHHEKDENGKVIEHPIEEDSGSSMSSFQGRSYQRQYGDNTGVNPHNHEAHAKAAFKSGMRSKSVKVREKVCPMVSNLLLYSWREDLFSNKSSHDANFVLVISVACVLWETVEKKRKTKRGVGPCRWSRRCANSGTIFSFRPILSVCLSSPT